MAHTMVCCQCAHPPQAAKESAEAYEQIWTKEGSPLVVTSKKVHQLLQERLEHPVELAMRYQSPSIESALEKLHSQGVTDLFMIPLFPHYAMSSFETAVERVKELIAQKSFRDAAHHSSTLF
jgi:ferrochelatase